MEILEREIKTYDLLKASLVKNHRDKFVVIHGDKLAGVYDNFNNAAEAAFELFGTGPYLIRQVVGIPIKAIPASIAYRMIPCH